MPGKMNQVRKKSWRWSEEKKTLKIEDQKTGKKYGEKVRRKYGPEPPRIQT